MTSTSIFRVDLEPPAWLYALMVKGPLINRVYRRFAGDLALSLPPEARLLDLGTGPGRLLDHLARERPDVRLFGLDISYKMICHARKRRERPAGAFLSFLVANAAALPISGEAFDRIIATFSFHIWKHPERGVAEMLRVLRPEGQGWIYELNGEVTARDLRRFAREEKLPFPLVYLGFKGLCWPHALKARDFVPLLPAGGALKWRLHQAHHLFWRLEVERR